MKECCTTCRNMLKLQKLDYTNGGCKHTDMDGFACIALSREGNVDWMVGVDPDTGMCECYESKEGTDADKL